MHCIHNRQNVIKRFRNSKELAELTMVIMSVLVNWLISRTPCEQYFSCIREKNRGLQTINHVGCANGYMLMRGVRL